MRIAFVTSEFDGAVSSGGIGTYVRHAADMLAEHGNAVEIFTRDAGDVRSDAHPGVLVHRIRTSNAGFPAEVVDAFSSRHLADPFDVVEGPEFGAQAAGVRFRFPELPLAVKLHTPSFVVDELSHRYIPLATKARFIAGALLRGQRVRPYWHYDPATDPEMLHTLSADRVVAVSQAILDRLRPIWPIPRERACVVPIPFRPRPELLSIPPSSGAGIVTFIGRLEPRKGVLELARAIVLLLRRNPKLQFRLIGRNLPMPGGSDVATEIRRIAGRYASAIEMPGPVPYSDIPSVLARTDICVFPSLWENSPLVCREAMAAGRAVVGSVHGGMPELIEDGVSGLLVDPRRPPAIADAILRLVEDRELRTRLGEQARSSILSRCDPDVVYPLHIASYQAAIASVAEPPASPGAKSDPAVVGRAA